MFNRSVLPRTTLSSDSEGWLIAALDPYHDYQYEVHGLPDERSAPSVVQIHNQSYTLTAPAIAGSSTWDASVEYSGFSSAIGAKPGLMTVASTAVHPYDHNSISIGQPFGALNIWAGAAGSPWITGAPYITGETHDCLGSCLTTDRCRVIAVALEIHNTTAEIYRQGSLTVAQRADVARDARSVQYMDTNGTPHLNFPSYQADLAGMRASTLAPLLGVPGAQTWPAAEGCYVVPRMVEVPRNVNLFLASGDRTPVVYGSDGKAGTLEPSAFTPTPFFVPTIEAVYPSGFCPVQVFFSGLSNQTSLTITFRTIVEYFPALGSALLPLAEPSPTYDPSVFGAYSAIIKEAPYAVPVSQNAAGDYFKKILRVVSTALDLTSPMFGTYAPLVALAAKAGGLLASRLGPKVDRKSAGRGAVQGAGSQKKSSR